EARIRELGGQTPRVAEAPEEAPAARLPAGRSRLTPPIAGTPSQRFGGRSAGWSWRSSHEAVGAPAAGRVAYAGPLKEWGEVVILDLGPGWRAVIAGLDRLEVETGQRVGDGQTLGRTGEDGEAYFELRRQERPIDPAPWLQ
ncbi:peptidoglycan DD-metalloendopeptidase family protein, partial [Brevundimonas sp.]